MPFLNKAMLRRCVQDSKKLDEQLHSDALHPMLVDTDVPRDVRMVYLQGCVWAAMLDDGDISYSKKRKLERLGKSLQLSEEEISDCIIRTAKEETSEVGKENIVRKVFSTLSGEFYPKYFMRDFEDNLLKIGDTLPDEMAEYLDLFGVALIGPEDWKCVFAEGGEIGQNTPVVRQRCNSGHEIESSVMKSVDVDENNIVEKAKAAYRGQRWDDFRKLMMKCDNAEAQLCAWAGECYTVGKGGPIDYAMAATWFLLGANKESAYSQRLLGHFYTMGLGVSTDFDAALKWFDKAITNGDGMALWLKGDLLYTKLQRHYEGIEACREAAIRGITGAIEFLADVFIGTCCVEVDKSKVIEWISNQDSSDCALVFARLYEHVNRLDKAVLMYRKSAELGCVDAMYHMGRLTSGWKNLEKNVIEAARWYTKAAEKGHAGAQYYLGELYMNEIELQDVDFHRARKWLMLALKNGNMRAKDKLDQLNDRAL